MKPLMRKIFWRVGRFLLLLYAGLALFGCVASEQMIFQPQPGSYGAGLSGLREVKADDGKTDSDYGDECGHTRISKFIPWIRENMK